MTRILLAVAVTAALTAPAFAASYPLSGFWGVSTSAKHGTIDCSKRRVIGFNGNQRTDSNGGVPGYRNKSVEIVGPARYRIVDEFTNGLVSYAYVNYTLRILDEDHVEMIMEYGGTLKLQRCE